MRLALGCVLLLGVAGLAHGQDADVLSVKERDLDNGLHEIALQPGIVDINSTITVNIDKAKLRNELSSLYDRFPSEQLQVIEGIQASIKEGMDALPAVQQALVNYVDDDRPSQEEINLFFESTKKAATPAVKILTLAQQEPRLRALINERQRALPPLSERWERHRATFQAAAEYVALLERELDQLLAAQGVYVQMGGWLLSAGENRPIHLPGFDMYPLGEFHEVERWRLTALLSEENKKRYESAAETARQINEQGKSVSEVLSPMLPKAVSVAFDSIQACAKQLEAPVTALRGSTDSAVLNARQLADAAEQSLRSYVAFLVQLKDKYKDLGDLGTAELPGLLQQLAADLDTLREQTASLKNNIEKLHENLKTQISGLSTQGKNSVTEMKTALDNCQSVVRLQVATLQGVVGMLKNGREIATASLEYTDKVLKHDLDALPQSARFDLRTTGPRREGDSVVLRISAGRQQEAVRHIEERYLRLYQVLTYVDVAVSLIFADPKEEFDLGSRFIAAPSYSVLLKKGSRRSTFCNELLQLGVGLNFAALDFNADQSMEFGVGVTLSAFRDYLQLGYGYNLNEDSAYWFVGLKFPIPDAGTGAISQ